MKFSPWMIVVLGGGLWIWAQQAPPDQKKAINAFLGVLLFSMVLLRWDELKPIVLQQSTAKEG